MHMVQFLCQKYYSYYALLLCLNRNPGKFIQVRAFPQITISPFTIQNRQGLSQKRKLLAYYQKEQFSKVFPNFVIFYCFRKYNQFSQVQIIQNMENLSFKVITPKNPVYAIAKKQILVPKHIIKYLYREGEGDYPSPGASIYAYYSCHLIDGKSLVNKQKNAKRFTIGTGRLIEGLQIAFQTARKNEKFTVIISPEYAYKDLQTDQSFPKNQKFVFDFEIISIQYLSLSEKSQADVMSEIKNLNEGVIKLLKNQQFSTALESYEAMVRLINSLSYYKYTILIDLYLMKMQIYCYLQKFEQALIQHQRATSIYSFDQRLWLIGGKIHEKIGNIEKSKQLMKKYYNQNSSNLEKRRQYVEYLKRMGDELELKDLDGYNFEKDQVFKNTRKNNRQKNFRMFYY